MTMVSLEALAWIPSSILGASVMLLFAGVRTKVDPRVRRCLHAVALAPAGRHAARSDRFFERIGGGRFGGVLAARNERNPRSVRRTELAGSPWSRTSMAGRVIVSSSAGAAATLLLSLVVRPAAVFEP